MKVKKNLPQKPKRNNKKRPSEFLNFGENIHTCFPLSATTLCFITLAHSGKDRVKGTGDVRNITHKPFFTLL